MISFWELTCLFHELYLAITCSNCSEIPVKELWFNDNVLLIVVFTLLKTKMLS